MQTLSHRTFYRMVMAGAREIIARERELNAINVFPVADGDTGSNLAHLMRMIVRDTTGAVPPGQMLDVMKRACLRGARGNSGMIFSQWMIAMCDYMDGRPELGLTQFVDMCERSAKMSRQSVHAPLEGTVLTVMSDWAEALKAKLDASGGLADLLRRSFDAARISMENTSRQLAALRKHNVVDAGAKGFVHFLQGLSAGLEGDAAEAESAAEREASPATDTSAGNDDCHVLSETAEYRYCAEFLFDAQSPDMDRIRSRLTALGDSIVSIGSREQGRIHIHTNEPDQVADAIQEYGSIVYQKVEDMRRQYETIHDRRASIALVVDSACDITDSRLDDDQIHRLPLHVQIGSSTYLDKVTLRADTFYDKLDRLTDHPTTSQPSAETIEALYRQLLEHYEHVVSVHVAKPLSGTYEACRRAADRIDPERVRVVDSRTLSGACGLLVLRAAEAIRAGKSVDDVLSVLASSIPRTDILVSVPTLKHMIRGGRVGPLQGSLARWLGLKPIVSVDREGKSKLYGTAFLARSGMNRMLRMIARGHRDNPIQEYVVLHAGAAADGERCAEAMIGITGFAPLYMTDVSPVVGLHAGKGAVSVAMLLQEDNLRRLS